MVYKTDSRESERERERERWRHRDAQTDRHACTHARRPATPSPLHAKTRERKHSHRRSDPRFSFFFFLVWGVCIFLFFQAVRCRRPFAEFLENASQRALAELQAGKLEPGLGIFEADRANGSPPSTEPPGSKPIGGGEELNVCFRICCSCRAFCCLCLFGNRALHVTYVHMFVPALKQPKPRVLRLPL